MLILLASLEGFTTLGKLAYFFYLGLSAIAGLSGMVCDFIFSI